MDVADKASGCPFCGAKARTERTFSCFTRSGSSERTVTCLERENKHLKDLIATLTTMPEEAKP